MLWQSSLPGWTLPAAPTLIIGHGYGVLTSMVSCVAPSHHRTIANIFERNHRCYGYRRIRAALGRQHVFISEKIVQRLMRQERLMVAVMKRRRYGSYLGEITLAPDNLLHRDFQAAMLNEKWLTDITEFQIPAGKVYLSPMIDCFDGLVISWSIGTCPDAGLVNTMLDAAIEKVANSNERPLVHSDRGAH